MMFQQQKNLFTGCSCKFMQQCAMCKPPTALGAPQERPLGAPQERPLGAPLGKGFTPPEQTSVINSKPTTFTPLINHHPLPIINQPQGFSATTVQKAVSEFYYSSKFVATTNIPDVKDVKTMGLLVCTAVGGSVKNIGAVKGSESTNLFKAVVENYTYAKRGRLTTVAPLAAIKLSRKDLKDLMDGDETELDELDTCEVYLNLLRRLITETLHTKTEIINYVLYEADRLKNKRLFFTVKFSVRNPAEIIKSMLKTEVDTINVFTAALAYFVNFDNKPLEAMKAAELANSYFPSEVGKVLGGMVGASYGDRWIPEEWTKIQSYQSMLNLTKFFRTVGTSKLV